MSLEPPTGQSVGQISADRQFRWDGQQWVPLATNEREPTPWTRPMQLIVAAVFVLSALGSVITTLVFVNHDSMLNAVRAQGTLPSGTDVDAAVNLAIGVTYGFVILLAVLWLVAAVGSYLGWRWMFWAALVLYGLSAISAFTNLSTLSNPSKSPIPTAGLIVSELFSVIGLGLFVWMLVAAIKYGPWAMKKPGT
jgi:hypothetical protein